MGDVTKIGGLSLTSHSSGGKLGTAITHCVRDTRFPHAEAVYNSGYLTDNSLQAYLLNDTNKQQFREIGAKLNQVMGCEVAQLSDQTTYLKLNGGFSRRVFERHCRWEMLQEALFSS